MAVYSGGYDCEFVEKPPKIVQSDCPVCLQIIREPHQADCCGYAFCRVCIERVKAANKPCPCCKAEKFDKFEDKRLKRILYGFKVFCINKIQGCKWVGELDQLDNHLDSNPSQEKQPEKCQFTQIKCVHCSSSIQRSSIQLHQTKQCPKRPFSCEYCKNFDSTYEDITTNHWPACGHYPVQCTNRCGKTITRQQLHAHISNNCPLTVIDCEFSHVGCKVNLPREDMAEHLKENVVKHLSLHAANYKQLKEENETLKEKVAKLTQDLNQQQICTPICPAMFTMTNFQQHKLHDDTWHSPPFYTHPKGYKMCINVTANSFDNYEGTHTAVGVSLMKGEFDDQLEWPFQGHITIRLLSQIDEDYKETEIDFIDPDDTVASRVLTKEDNIAEEGRGSNDFISHNDLRPKYLKNDCLKFCAYRYIRF